LVGIRSGSGWGADFADFNETAEQCVSDDDGKTFTSIPTKKE
jgi:hypothetical protein